MFSTVYSFLPLSLRCSKGVNEAQSVANVAGSTDLQTEINRKGVADLWAYYHAFAEFEDQSLTDTVVPPRSTGSGPSGAATRRQLTELLESLNALVEAEAKDRGKHVDLLLVSSFAARLMNGARTTSCKSAKDRTSVFHTLEVARLAEVRGFLDRSREQECLDALRGPSGVRLRNAQVNTGKLRYAFNPLQLQALPKVLRPPQPTAAGGAS